MDGRGLVGTVRAAGAAWWTKAGRPVPGRPEPEGAGRRRSPWRRRRTAAGRPGSKGPERARVPGPARGAQAGPGGGVISFERSSLTVRVAVGGALFLGWDGAEPLPSRALPGEAPEADVRAVLEPDKDGGWRVVSERLLVTVSRHGAVEVRTPGGELLRRDLPPRWWETETVGGRLAHAGRESNGDGRWLQRSQVTADARFFGLGGRTCGPRLPDGSYRLHPGGSGSAADASRDPHAPRITMPVQLVVADAGTHLVFHDNAGEGRITIREGQEGRGSGHDRTGSSEIRMSGGPLRYWVITGPPARVLHGWSRLTGAPSLPPGWALGYQHAVPAAGAARRLRELAEGYREHELPLRALHLDADAGHAGRRVLRGHRHREADLPRLAAELSAHGVRLVSPGDAEASTMADARSDARSGTRSGTLPGSPSESPSDPQLESPHPDGEFALVGSGWAGMQREGGTWGGELATGWDGLRESLSLVVGLGLCGVPYCGPGIGGSAGAASPELYLRWFQLAAYFPLFHAHCAKSAGVREPWAFGGEVLKGCADAMAERERLRPYFTTLAHLAQRTGAPYVRPLWWQHPRERSLRECGDAFLLGDALLIAPVLEEGSRRRPVRLPHGRWYETVTGSVHDGPGEVLVDAPLSRIPVLARAGAAVPVRGSDGTTELDVWPPAPGRTGKGLLIRDNAHGRRRQHPAAAERFTVLRREGTTVVASEDGGPAGYRVRLRG
jgi:alpha-glucosidase